MIHYKQLFTQEECDSIIKLAQSMEDVNWDIVAKKYNGWYFNYCEANSWVYNRLFEWMKEITGEIVDLDKLEKNAMESPMFVHRYKKGDFFIRHKDKMPNNTYYRIYNFGIQLSSDYEGGELLAWDDHENEYVFPKDTGTALFYSSEYAHEVKPITSGERFSFILILDSDYIKKENKLI